MANGKRPRLVKIFGIANGLNVDTCKCTMIRLERTTSNQLIKSKICRHSGYSRNERELRGTKDLKDYITIYSGVDLTRALCGVATFNK